jgi:hypothetical protein
MSVDAVNLLGWPIFGRMNVMSMNSVIDVIRLLQRTISLQVVILLTAVVATACTGEANELQLPAYASLLTISSISSPVPVPASAPTASLISAQVPTLARPLTATPSSTNTPAPVRTVEHLLEPVMRPASSVPVATPLSGEELWATGIASVAITPVSTPAYWRTPIPRPSSEPAPTPIAFVLNPAIATLALNAIQLSIGGDPQKVRVEASGIDPRADALQLHLL